jgi:predicted DNA-binding transcriptional regulator YafY
MGDILCHSMYSIFMRADRLVSIILILERRGKRTCASLAKELEVSRRTILRDIEALSYAGIPVQAEGGHGGGVSLDEAYKSGLSGLGEAELRALLLGADASLADDLGMGEALRAAKLKIEAAGPKRFEPALEALRRRILVDSRWWWHEKSSDVFLAPLQDAVFRDEIVEVEYEHYDGSFSRGRLEPYGLVAKSGFWYLVGRREGEFRSYRVSRFRELIPTGELFSRDGLFDLREWWPTNAERFAAEFSAYRFMVVVPEASLPFLRRIAPGRADVRGPDALRPGWVEVEVGLDSSMYAELIVLGLGTECRVLEPASLAAAVAERARRALEALGRES